MRNQRRNEILVGLTVVVGIVILLFGFAEFKEWQAGSSQYTLRVRFPNAAGLEVSDPVFLNGIKAGKVESIELQDRSVLVVISIDKVFSVSSDASVSIQMLELMGGKKIDIHQGTAASYLAPDTELPGKVEADIAGALSFVGDLEDDVQTMATRANSILAHVDTIVGDPRVIASIKETAENLRVLSGEIRAMVTENRGSVREVTSTVRHLTRNVDSLITAIDPELRQGVRTANSALRRGDSLLVSVHQLVTDIRESRGILHKVLNDTTLNTRLDQLLVKTDSLANIIINGDFKVRIRL